MGQRLSSLLDKEKKLLHQNILCIKEMRLFRKQQRYTQKQQTQKHSLVHGWIRMNHKNTRQIFPISLIQICQLYFSILSEKWSNGGLSKRCCYKLGSIIVTKEDLQIWRFRVTEKNAYSAMMFGIRQAGDIAPASRYFLSIATNGNIVAGTKGRERVTKDVWTRDSFGPLDVDDIVEMTLDMRNNDRFGALSITVNGVDKNIHIKEDEIDIEKNYCLCVIWRIETSLELLMVD